MFSSLFLFFTTSSWDLLKKIKKFLIETENIWRSSWDRTFRKIFLRSHFRKIFNDQLHILRKDVIIFFRRICYWEDEVLTEQILFIRCCKTLMKIISGWFRNWTHAPMKSRPVIHYTTQVNFSVETQLRFSWNLSE